MSRPFRRFCFSIAEKLGKDIDEVLEWDSTKLIEWAAYYKTQDEEWVKNFEEQRQLEEQRGATPEEKAQRMRAFFTGR